MLAACLTRNFWVLLAISIVIALGAALWVARPLKLAFENLSTATLGLRGPEERQEAYAPNFEETEHLARAINEAAHYVDRRHRDLSRDQRQLQAILASLVESVAAIDHQGRLLFLNPAAEALFQVHLKDVRLRPYGEVLRHSPLLRVIQEALEDKGAHREEISLHSPQERILIAQAQMFSYEEGRHAVLVTLHDITELRKLERLRQEFVANVSHELKTPLTSIKGYAETLLEGALEDPQHNREFLKTILDHTHRLERLIDDVLDLSAIEARRTRYAFAQLNMKEAVSRIIKEMEPMARSKGIAFENTLADDLPSVRADPDRLAQILMNLMDNAIKFNRSEGFVRLAASYTAQDLTVAVEDSGPGVSAEDLPRLFERFYRVDKSRGHEVPGTGLGLSIVKHLVEEQGGTVRARSTPGQGSTFEFTLPLGS